MDLRIQVVGSSKRGNAESEYEDAANPNSACTFHGEVFRCAVADGATEASFSGAWASMLTEAWVEGMLGFRQTWLRLSNLQERWQNGVNDKALPWYAEEKVRSGAFAALLGFRICARPHRRWHSIAVGDCCLVHVRRDQVIRAFPLEHASEFSNSPFLVPSRETSLAGLAHNTRRARGTFQSGDTFFLMTDAVAAWLLSSPPAPAELLDAMKTDFAGWLCRARSTAVMRNDDVTVLAVEVM